MSAATQPRHEAERLRTLQDLRLIDQTEADPMLDGLVRVAAQALSCPAAAISWIDAEQQWLKATVGLAWRQVARRHSLCAQVIDSHELLEIHDALTDPRLAGHPMLAGPEPIRFYAGMPIRIDGHALGTLCVIDHVPRKLGTEQRGVLANLSCVAEHWLRSRRDQLALRAGKSEHRKLSERHRELLDELEAQRVAAIEQVKAVAESASRAMNDFLATMSHEIRTPLSGVIGAAALLQRSNLNQHQRDLATVLHDSALAVLTPIDGMLDFSKIEAGHLDIERAPLDLRDLLERACDALRPLAQSRGIHLHLFVDPAVPARLLGDATRWRQVVTNLLSNAIKFSAGLDRPGRVAVRAQPAPGSGLRISVTDNGIGLSPQAQARLFQPFVQAEPDTARRYGGTGLGLSICHRLVAAMGGRISVISLPDEGAQFTVDLPLAAVAPPPLAAHDLAGLDCHLVVADEQWAEDWGRYLAAAGAQVTRWRELPPAEAMALRSPNTVLVVQAVLLGDIALPATGVHVGVPRVELHHGRRRSPRALPGQRVSLDIEHLHSDSLLAAVAMAAGRIGAVTADGAALAPH